MLDYRSLAGKQENKLEYLVVLEIRKYANSDGAMLKKIHFTEE